MNIKIYKCSKCEKELGIEVDNKLMIGDAIILEGIIKCSDCGEIHIFVGKKSCSTEEEINY